MARLSGVAVVFPGQGSQVVGMGVDVARTFPRAQALFQRAAAVLGYDLLELVRNGPEERLRESRYSQPAIFVTNVALYAALEGLRPQVSAGHSFGEFCSLTIAGSLAFDEGLRLVNERALAMHDAAEAAPGAMAAILGLEPGAIRIAVASAGERGRVQLANFNSPTQIVISGDVAAVEYAGALALEAGAKRVVPLNVSGAWHSALMEPAQRRFAPIVAAAAIALPSFDVISNVDAQPYRDVATIRANLTESITAEVLWHETMLRVLQERPRAVIEFGASAVLTPLLRRLPDAPAQFHVGDAAAVTRVGESLKSAA